MTLVRTNITIPKEILDLVDEVAGPRGRSAYISELVAREAKRDRARKILRETAGALKDSPTWGRTPEEVDETLAEIKDSSERDRMLYGEDW
jgi:metal-responsive CopG/Arc/MetJ family transcriptional regulator